jgi:hypothetical protein
VGALAIVFAFVSPLIGLVLGIVAIVLGHNSKQKGERHGDTAFYLGIGAVALSVLWIVVGLIFVATMFPF